MPKEEGKEESGHVLAGAAVTPEENHYALVTSVEKIISACVKSGLTTKGKRCSLNNA